MSVTEKQKLAKELRKTAAHFREQANELTQASAIKCAQVLTAARGLGQLKQILRGAR